MAKKIRNILIIGLLSIIFLMTASFAVMYYYRTELIALFVREANKRINTPVDVQKIGLDLWSQFPDVSISLDEVRIYEARELAGDYLCAADKIILSFDLLHLIFKNYNITTLYFENARVNMMVDTYGRRNFDIFDNKDTTSTDSLPELTLQKIILKNTTFNYSDLENEILLTIYTDQLTNKLGLKNEILSFRMEGGLTNKQMKIRDTEYLKDQEIEILTDFEYGIFTRDLVFNESDLMLNGQTYLVNGKIRTGEERYIDLEINSAGNAFQSIIGLLPDDSRESLSKYKSSGEIEFTGRISGNYGHEERPEAKAEFSCRDVSFFYPGYKKAFSNIRFDGNFTNGINHNLQTSRLEIREFSGDIDGHKIAGNLVLNDLKNLNSRLNLAGKIDLDAFIRTFPVKQVISGKGMIDFDISVTGPLKNFKNTYATSLKTSGEILLQDVEIHTGYTPLAFRDFNGKFFFNNLDLGIQNFSGYIGQSDFELSGFFKNIIPYVINKENPIRIEADLQSHYLNLNELLTLDFRKRSLEKERTESVYHLGISPKLNIGFNCDVKKADLKRFHGKNISGRLLISDQIALVKDVSMSTMGGQLYLDGSIVGKHPVHREFQVYGLLDNIYVDSVFYVFNNFRQQFLVDRNLRGQIDARVNTYFVLTEDLNLMPATINADIEANIKQGQLIDFKPIQSLSKYLKNEDLSNVRFSDLQNNVQIANSTVIIPEMEIISSAYHIDVSGTHTFRQEIDYHFKIPLDQFRGTDPDSRFGEIDAQDSGPPNLFLKMTGMANDYQVVYDTRAVTEKIKQDLKKEGDELKDLFRKNKDQKVKQVELEEDDYFEFD
ncbi:MAG: hypothetical protein KFF73_10385 [Cyclobacteriaceae bacterium]|nr:hypothetical protein [Cyclobacteriaceae bacterium]